MTRAALPTLKLRGADCHGLTLAKTRVLHAMARGLKLSAVAGSLGISARTVEQHLHEMRCVTQTRNMFQLGMWYARHFPNGAPE